MGDAITDRFPWVSRLVNDSKWTCTTTPSRLPKSSGEDSFFAETLATDRTMRSCLTLRCTQEDNDDQAYKEVRTIVELGEGLNGFPRTLHGGMAATLLDEICGVLIVLNSERKAGRTKNSDPVDHFMTACKFVSSCPNTELIEVRPQYDIQEAYPYTWCDTVHCQGRAARWPEVICSHYYRRWIWHDIHGRRSLVHQDQA